MKMNSKKGFTLVELMIVVAIIGLLAAIAIPNLLRARMNANDGAVKGDLRAFSTAIESYYSAQGASPQYPTAVSALTSATPPYLDSTWGDTTTKHGHTLTFTGAGTGYTLQAGTQTNASSQEYCVDNSGVLRKDTTVASSACTGAAI